MEINWGDLPKQDGPKCGAYATLYYLIKIGVLEEELKEKLKGEIKDEIKNKANEIYDKVKFENERVEGSHPNKIVNYINTLLKEKEVDLYYLKEDNEQVSKVVEKCKTDIVAANIDTMMLEFKIIDGKLEDILKENTNEKYGIGIYMPDGWYYKDATSLKELHYMLKI